MDVCAAGCCTRVECIDVESSDSTLLIKEKGKLLSESRVKLPAAVNAVRFAADLARMLEDRSPTLGPGVYDQVIFLHQDRFRHRALEAGPQSVRR